MGAAAKKEDVVIVDNYPGWNKYNIFNPNEVKYVPRTDFIESLCGHIDQQDNLEDIVSKNRGNTITEMELREYAAYYVKLKNKGARLPNFSRWITGMWVGNKDFANYLAKEGQKAAKRKIIMSGDLIDILRSADTPHFQSCFKKASTSSSIDRDMLKKVDAWSQYQYMPVMIAESCPGIGIVYVDDENGKMMGRQWMHHAVDQDSGAEVCVLTQGYYGCLQGNNLARLMAEKGVRVGYRVSGPTKEGGKLNPDQIRVQFIGCFTKPVHHDLDTWTPGSVVQLIKI